MSENAHFYFRGNQVRSGKPGARFRWIIYPLVVAGFLFELACAASFSPPARGDMGFAATRVAPGHPEIEAGLLTRGNTGYLNGGLALDDKHGFELGFLRSGTEDHHTNFSMGSVGYRHRFSEREDPVQFGIGVGLGVGTGGHIEAQHLEDYYGEPRDGMEHEVEHFNGVGAAYVDLGLSWRPLKWLTPFLGARVQRSVSDPGPDEGPPITDWTEFGGGVRLDGWNLFVVVSGQTFTYTNRFDEMSGKALNLGLGWRFGGEDIPKVSQGRSNPWNSRK